MALIINDECIACDACREECPTIAIEEGDPIYYIDPDRCTECVNIYDEPVLTSLSIDGAEILRKRVEAVVAEGFKTAANADVIASPSNYFINNYFNETDYTGFGHITGAHRILPLTLANGEYKNLDSSAKVVTYCYTGQTSAVVTACLRVLGYDAYSLTYGMNGLSHSSSQWASNHWGVDSHAKGLPVVN